MSEKLDEMIKIIKHKIPTLLAADLSCVPRTYLSYKESNIRNMQMVEKNRNDHQTRKERHTCELSRARCQEQFSLPSPQEPSEKDVQTFN
jgi:hypothetical protein